MTDTPKKMTAFDVPAGLLPGHLQRFPKEHANYCNSGCFEDGYVQGYNAAQSQPLTLPTGRADEGEFGSVNLNGEPLDVVSRDAVRIIVGDRVLTEEMLAEALTEIGASNNSVLFENGPYAFKSGALARLLFAALTKEK